MWSRRTFVAVWYCVRVWVLAARFFCAVHDLQFITVWWVFAAVFYAYSRTKISVRALTLRCWI